MRRTGGPCIISFHDCNLFSVPVVLTPYGVYSGVLCIDDPPWVKLHPHYVNNNNHGLYINTNCSSPFIFPSPIYAFTTILSLLL